MELYPCQYISCTRPSVRTVLVTEFSTSQALWSLPIPYFLHDRPWISPWIKSISNELSFTWMRHNCLVIVTSSTSDCDIISRRYGFEVWRSSFLSSFLSSLCHVRNKIMYVLSWRTISALTRVLFWCLFPSLRSLVFISLVAREINTKTTLSWALKQFVTRVHTLFSIYFPWSSNVIIDFAIIEWEPTC